MNILILVNKDHPLKEELMPSLLVETKAKAFSDEKFLVYKEVEDNLIKMFSDAYGLGLKLCISSAYRTHVEQEEVFKELPDRAAIPGTSEHETGLAVDIICEDMTKEEEEENPFVFETTKEFEWLRNNCYKYGFILRYPKGMEEITGIPYEPWHYRYVGIDDAPIIANGVKVLEKYIKE